MAATITTTATKICAWLALLVLGSCSSPSRWAVEHMRGDKAYSSSRLSYFSPDSSNGIDLEMFRTQEHLRLYLRVRSHTIPPHHGNPKEALVTINIGEQQYQCVAARHAGGQRLLIPQPTADAIIGALKANEPVKIELPGYAATVDPHHFAQSYKELTHPPTDWPLRMIVTHKFRF